MNLATSKYSINTRIENENSITYDIKFSKRITASKAWYGARTSGYPMNAMLTFEFEKHPINPRIDILHVRKVHHYCRIALKRLGTDHYVIWSRFTKPNSNVESVTMLMHVPDKSFKAFASQVQGWKFENINIVPCTYNRDIEVGNAWHTAFDVLMKACDSRTRDVVPTALFERSGAIHRTRMYHSQKLTKLVYNSAVTSVT